MKKLIMSTDTALPNKWMVTLTIMISTLVAALDTSIVNVALPNMRGSLGASVTEITWVSTAYMLSNVVVMPAVGFLSDLFGKVRFFTFSVIIFGVGSFLCGLAWNMESMIFFRVIQGVGGGALIPMSQAILRETFPPEEQGKAMGIFGMGVVLGPGIGPTLGGYITDNYSWNWIFYINMPFIILNLILISFFLKESSDRERHTGKIDYIGLILMTIGLSTLQIMLEKGQENSWFESDFIVRLAVTSAVSLILFIIWELKTDKPIVELRVLKDLSFTSATALGGIFGMGLFGSLFLLPMLFESLLGYSVMESGLALMPRSLAMAFAMPLAGRIYNFLGPKKMIFIATVLATISFYPLTVMNLNTNAWDILVPQLIQGVAFAFIFVSLSTAALMTVEKRYMFGASGLFNLIRTVCGSVGIAVFATMLENSTTINRAYMVEHIVTNNPFYTQSSLVSPATTSPILSTWFAGLSGALMQNAGSTPADLPDKTFAILSNYIDRHAAIMAYNTTFFWILFLFIVATLFSFLIRDTRPDKLKNKEDSKVIESVVEL
ncbi:DHA2 family efflux MFS transporter permease subunit [Thermodesulfobium narugense]|nr:DHA2 family efflux MFS transporter permease subunit [Thermodesulfobium narugense]